MVPILVPTEKQLQPKWWDVAELELLLLEQIVLPVPLDLATSENLPNCQFLDKMERFYDDAAVPKVLATFPEAQRHIAKSTLR